LKAHYLPACYLKGFLDPRSEADKGEPYLWTRDPATRKWTKRAPRNVATLLDYYAVTNPDGTKNHTRETALADLESQVAPVLRRIPYSDAITEADAHLLCGFAAMMYLRLPIVHEAAERSVVAPRVRSILERNWNVYKTDPATLRRSLDDCARDMGEPRVLDLSLGDLDPAGYRVDINREYVINEILALGPKITNLLVKMRWRLLRPIERHLFITSDLPVFVVDPKTPGDHSLESRGATLTLPLTKEVLLLGDWGGPPQMSWAGITAAGVRDMNLRCAGAPGTRLYSSCPGFLGEGEDEDG
jgi:hypothetical protein